MKKLGSVALAVLVSASAAPAFAATTPADVTTMLTNVDFSNGEAGIIAAGGLIAGLIVVGTAVKWSLKFLRS